MIFNKESDFEAALIKILSEKGWEKEVLKNYSEQDLLRNWANILLSLIHIQMCIRDSGTTDHVGIVEKCENGTVYTVEGNSGDACKQRQYAVGSSNIYGYGIPAY